MASATRPGTASAATVSSAPGVRLVMTRENAAQGGPDNRSKLPDAERVEQPALTLNHVADAKSRESQIRLRGAIAWRGGQPVADRVGADDEVAVRIERPVGPDKKIQAMMGRADRGQ